MSSKILGRIDELGGRIDELEKQIEDLVQHTSADEEQQHHVGACGNSRRELQ